MRNKIIIDLQLLLYPCLVIVSAIDHRLAPPIIVLLFFLWFMGEKPKYYNILKPLPLYVYLGSLLFSFLISEDKIMALKLLERFTPFLLLPFLIYNSNFKQKELRFFKQTLIFLTTLLALISLITLILFMAFNVDFVKSMDSNYLQWKLPRLISIHPTYLGYILSISLFLGLEELKKQNSFKPLFVITTIFISIYSVFLSSRVAVFTQVILWGYYIMTSVKFRKHKFFLITLTALFFGMFSWQSNYLKDKLLRGLEDERFYSWKFALDNVSTSEFVFGQGVGKSKEILRKKLTIEKELPDNFLAWDFHNQYIKTYTDQGVLGVIFLFFIIVHPFVIKNRHLIVFCVIMAISMLTESILGVVKGIIFFSVIYSFFSLEKQFK